MNSQHELSNELRDWGSRALWTALEAGIAVVLAANLLSFDISTAQTAAVAALSAGLTVASKFIRVKKTQSEEKTESSPHV